MGYVSIPVPEERVQEIYELLARLPVAQLPTTDDSEFSADEIQRMWNESGEPMKKFLAKLADHPGKEFTAIEMCKVLGLRTEQFRGVMGAFGHRTKSRYGWVKWPIIWRWDSKKSTAVYMMPSKIAELMNSAR